MKREGPWDSASAGRRTGLYGPYRPLILVVLFFSPILVFLLLAFAVGRSSGDRCAALEEIARDDAKVAYMQNWVETNLSEERFWGWVGKNNGLSRGYAKPHYLEAVGLDLEFMDMPSYGAGVDLHYIDLDGGNDRDNVEAVSFEYGRNAIIILTDRYDPHTSRDFRIASPTAKPVGDGVLVRCGYPGPD